MHKEAIKTYPARIEQFSFELKKLQNTINWIALIRLIEFLAGVFLLYYFVNIYPQQTFAFLTVLVFGLIFLYLVKIHASLKEQKQHLEFLILINQNEIAGLKGNLQPFEHGKELIEHEHPFTRDLDIFGEVSLFQFINRTSSIVGKIRLADWFKHPCKEKNEILQRQESVKELSEKLNWRQDFQTGAFSFKESLEEKEAILLWLKGPVSLVNKKLYALILFLFPLITITVVFLSAFDFIPARFVFIPILIQLGIVSLHTKRLLHQSGQISKRAKFLRKYARLLKAIEAEKFTSSKLIFLQQKLIHHKKTASQNLAKLADIIHNIDNGTSFTGLIFNGLFMWSLQYLYQFEKWQISLKDDLENWFAAIAETDALCSLANLYFNQNSYIFPTIVEADFVLKAEEAGHPLLPEEVRVNNPIHFEHLGQLLLITGANMAGKSTYLRTVGINLILAMTGAPVCAKSFEFQPVDIYTSMRTKDSLQSNESFFYAELKRLKNLIEALNKGEKIFFILDEILKGTNSADQHTGSKALIEQLVKLQGAGLVATHDLSLGNLADLYPKQINNYCFEIEIKGDELSFDYRLRQGISQNLNATFLMKKMGITV